MTTLLEYRRDIAKQLAPHTESPQLDAELLMMHATQQTRAQLFANPHALLSKETLQQINVLIKRRLAGEPIAYILGSQPFWTMDLIVTTDTLIPRPETECLVEWILHHVPTHDDFHAADLGTGTGAIAIALGLEKKSWQIDAVDESQEALAIARKNAVKHGAKNVSFYLSNWCDGLPKKNYDVIVSNPPYVAENDSHLTQLQFEPQTALVSGIDGLNAITHIVSQAKSCLKPGGYLVIEHGYDQSEKVAALFKNAGLTDVKNHHDLSDVPRFVTGKA